MCGRLNVTDCPEVIELCEQLGITLSEKSLKTSRFMRAASNISIIVEKQKNRELLEAIWWLLLEQTDTGFRPSTYTSFNTRYDKLNVPRSAGYHSYRHQRCIIPAKGFGETEKIDGKLLYHDFIAETSIAFGGLYREWVHDTTGEVVYSCSIVTLPPHSKLMPYHTKASPLMLPEAYYDLWLSQETSISVFNQLMRPNLCVALDCVSILKPSQPIQMGDMHRLQAD